MLALARRVDAVRGVSKVLQQHWELIGKEMAMKDNRAKVFLGLVVACVLCGSAVGEDEPSSSWFESVIGEGKPSFGIDAAYNSKYVSRGVVLTDDPVFQPGSSVTYGYFKASIWGNMDLTDVNDNENQFNEADYTIDYTRPLNATVNLSAGGIYYDFPNTDLNGTAEVYTGIGLNTLLNPSLKAYFDVDESDGCYVSASVSHSEPIREKLSLEIAASLGWGSAKNNDFTFGVPQAGMTDLAVTVGFPISLGKLTVKPAATYAQAIDTKLRDAVGSDAGNVIWGVTASLPF